jgi:putative thioredoxin
LQSGERAVTESPYIFEITSDNYEQIVLRGSREVPVLVDFWASWCQPCQVLMPVLAKLADEYRGRFVLAKLNTEEQQAIAAQFGIRSIPTVMLFKGGEPIDEFMGALPEAQIRAFLDKHLPRESDNAVAEARQQLLLGDAATALRLLRDAQAADPANPRVAVALVQAPSRPSMICRQRNRTSPRSATCAGGCSSTGSRSRPAIARPSRGASPSGPTTARRATGWRRTRCWRTRSKARSRTCSG